MPIASPLIFMRHGETDWNMHGRYQGAKNTPLNTTGFAQAQQNAELILRTSQTHLILQSQPSIVTSPLMRARETAETVCTVLNLQRSEIISNAAFKEVSAGRWEGLTSQQVKERFYEERKRRKTDRWNFFPQGGESMDKCSKFIQPALAELQANTIIVTHSVVLRILWHILGGLAQEEAAQLSIPHVGLHYWDGRSFKNIPNS